MIGVTRADHDTDRLDQSMTVTGYDLVSISIQPYSLLSLLSPELQPLGLACCGGNLSGEIFGFSLPMKYGFIL